MPSTRSLSVMVWGSPGLLLQRLPLPAAALSLLLDETEVVSQLGVELDSLLHVSVQIVTGLIEGEKALLLLQLGELGRLHQFVERLDPPLVLFIGHLRAHEETADDRPDDIEALFLGRRDVLHDARQALIVEDCQDADGSTAVE